MGSVLLPVGRVLSVLGVAGDGAPAGRSRRRGGGLLLGHLVPVGLLPGLDHVGHHGVDERQGLDGPAVEQRPILDRQTDGKDGYVGGKSKRRRGLGGGRGKGKEEEGQKRKKMRRKSRMRRAERGAVGERRKEKEDEDEGEG